MRPLFRFGGLKLSKLPQKIRNYFTDDAVSALKAAIQDAKGNELSAGASTAATWSSRSPGRQRIAVSRPCS